MLEILDQDSHFIAVNKPAGLVTIPGRGNPHSVLERLSRQIGLPHCGTLDPRLRVVHRLDKDASGVLIFAKNLATQRHLSQQFQNNTVHKEYLALVVGRPQQIQGVIDAPIGPHRLRRDRMDVLKQGGRAARTEWKLERSFRQYSLLRVLPRTGRTHQIRVHLAHSGMPLAIDPLYGSSAAIFLSQFKRDYRAKRDQQQRPLIDRLTLHAERLHFEHPSGRAITLVAALPKDLRAVLNMLTKYG